MQLIHTDPELIAAVGPRIRKSPFFDDTVRSGLTSLSCDNHGLADDTLTFAATTRDEGLDLALVAPVPVMTDRRSVDVLAQFPGVELPSGDVRRILDSTDPVGAGVDVAVGVAQLLLASGRVAGVNLSGIATGAGPRERSGIMRPIAMQLVDR